MTHEHSNKLHRLRTLHLFAGAGGGLLSDILLGHLPVCAVEINAYCQQVLHARQKDGYLPWFPIFDDVRTFDGKPWSGLVDVVAGGFPCQDISAAGKGAGIDGERSGLWGEMRRVVCEVAPRFVFVENSPMLTLRGLGRVLGDLAEMGYDARWCVLGAADAGAPHRRERIWILADAKSGESGITSKRERREDSRRGSGDCGRSQETRCQDVAHSNGGRLSECESEGKQVSWLGGSGETMSDTNWWKVEPGVGRMVDELAARVERLKALGNGQVPACAAIAWKILSGMA